MLEQTESQEQPKPEPDPPSSSPSKPQCDHKLIQHVQDAIVYIKEQRQQCNLKSIFQRIKAVNSDHPKLATLTEKELMKQLEQAVKDGILSRKLGGSLNAGQDAGSTSHTKPALKSPASTSQVYKLPDMREPLGELDRQHLSLLLQLLIKSIAALNQQNFSDIQSIASGASGPTNENTCSLLTIRRYLSDTYKFQPAASSEQPEPDCLRDCVAYLLKKNEKIFIKCEQHDASDDDDIYKYKLNSTYIQQKLQQTQLIAQQSVRQHQHQNQQQIKQPDLKQIESSVSAKDLNLDIISKLLGYAPPFKPEQIVKIESLKKPTVLCNQMSDLCSFCLRPEKSNPLGQYDKFLTCCDCASSGHAYCLKYSPNLIEHLRAQSTKWQCIECKRCSVCLMTCESMLLCDKCDRGYHKECCQPALSKRPKGQFVCHVCKELSEANAGGSSSSSSSKAAMTFSPSIKSNTSFSSPAASNNKKKRKLSISNAANGSASASESSEMMPSSVYEENANKEEVASQANLKSGIFFKLICFISLNMKVRLVMF
jgi:histone acetyltransferase MYST3/histone acetyltransferase MYST4